MEFDREESLRQLAQEVAGLRDLFTRRLMQDKQKNEMIRTLEDGARFAFIEPFLYDLILLLDRIEGEEDEMVISVREELEEILERRGLRRIETGENFDPKRCRIVKAIDMVVCYRDYPFDVFEIGFGSFQSHRFGFAYGHSRDEIIIIDDFGLDLLDGRQQRLFPDLSIIHDNQVGGRVIHPRNGLVFRDWCGRIQLLLGATGA